MLCCRIGCQVWEELGRQRYSTAPKTICVCTCVRFVHADRSRLRDQIAEVLKSMKNMFSDLTKKQSDALTRPLDKLLNSNLINLITYLSMFLGCEIPTEAVLGLHPSHVCRCDEAGPHHEQLHCEVEDSCLQEHGLMLQPYLIKYAMHP